MRTRRPVAALAVAALLAVPACDADDDGALVPLAAVDRDHTAPPRFEPPARLCDAIPGEVVAAATGRSPVAVDGAGSQCSWRSASADDGDEDLVLQGSFIDARSFEVGRPPDGAADVDGLGDDAYLVRPDDAAPTTLYVRAGSVAFALWLTDPAATEPEGTLAHLARQVLAS